MVSSTRGGFGRYGFSGLKMCRPSSNGADVAIEDASGCSKSIERRGDMDFSRRLGP